MVCGAMLSSLSDCYDERSTTKENPATGTPHQSSSAHHRCGHWERHRAARKQPDTLRLRQLSIVDANGVERVRIGAPLPEPLMLGKRVPRDGSLSGILLFDAEGTERTGYATGDSYPNVIFTLDSCSSMRESRTFGISATGKNSWISWRPPNESRSLARRWPHFDCCQ